MDLGKSCYEVLYDDSQEDNITCHCEETMESIKTQNIIAEWK